MHSSSLTNCGVTGLITLNPQHRITPSLSRSTAGVSLLANNKASVARHREGLFGSTAELNQEDFHSQLKNFFSFDEICYEAHVNSKKMSH